MNTKILQAALAVAALLCAGRAWAEEAAGPEEKEPTAIIEVGASAEWGLKHGGSSYGPSISGEVTAIPHALAVELGTSPMFSHGQTEWGTDLLFKTPFTLSKHLEVLVGAGPKWVHTSDHDSAAVEAVAQLMVWPGEQHRFGWYVGPSYSYGFSAEHDQAAGVHTGLLIAIP
jgi:hypothetical protein